MGRRSDVGRHQVCIPAFFDIERLAVVGEKKWQEWMIVTCGHLRRRSSAISITPRSETHAHGWNAFPDVTYRTRFKSISI